MMALLWSKDRHNTIKRKKNYPLAIITVELKHKQIVFTLGYIFKTSHYTYANIIK